MKEEKPTQHRVLPKLPLLIRSKAFTTTRVSLSQSIIHPPGALNVIDLICHWDVIVRVRPKTETGYVHSKEEQLADSRVVLIFILLILGPIITLSKAIGGRRDTETWTLFLTLTGWNWYLFLEAFWAIYVERKAQSQLLLSLSIALSSLPFGHCGWVFKAVCNMLFTDVLHY